MQKIWILIAMLITFISLKLSTIERSNENSSLWSITLEVTVFKRIGQEFVPFSNKMIEMNVDHEQFIAETDRSGVFVIHITRNVTSDYLLRKFRVYSISFPELMFLEKVEGDIYYYHRSWVVKEVKGHSIYYQIGVPLVPKIVKMDQESCTCFYSLKVYITRAKVYSFICLNPFSLERNVYIYNYNWIPFLRVGKICIPEDLNILVFSARFDARIYGARGTIFKSYRMSYSIPLGDVLYDGIVDITPMVITRVHLLITDEAKGIKKKLECFNLWSESLEDQFTALMSLLNSSRKHCLSKNYVLSAYENKVALRILKELEESSKLVNIISNYFITPLLLFAITIFSYFTARIISERKWHLIAIILFIATTLVFMKASSYFSLYLTTIITPLFAEPPEMHLFRIGLLTFLITLFLALLHPKVSSKLSILELTIRNICNRRRRFALALIVVSLVSSATVTHLKTKSVRVMMKEEMPYTSVVDSGLTVKKFSVNYLYGQDVIVRQMNLSYDETLWLLSFSNMSSCFGSARVKLLIGNNEISCDAGICDINYLIKLCNLMNALLRYNETLLNSGLLISHELVKKFNVSIGDEVKVFNAKFFIAGYFDKSRITELVDIDGDKIFGPIDVILLQRDVLLKNFYPKKVSIVLSPNTTPSLEELVKYIGTIGLDIYKVFDPSAYGGRGAIRIVGYTYSINIIHRRKVMSTMMLHEEYTILGVWELQTILIAMGALIVFITAMGSVYERRREAQIVSSLGASPSTIFAIFSLEGLIVGLIGGMLGFFIGFASSLIVNITIKSLPLSTLGITEFFILLIIGSITSVTGYIVPTVRASLLVVPSGRYLIKAASEEELSKVIKRTKRELIVQLPFKFLLNEEGLLDRFLSEEFVKIQSSRMYGITLTKFNKEVKKDITNFVYDISYKSPWHGLPISLTIIISLKKNGILTPIVSIKSNFGLGLIRSDIKDLISSIREGLLYYVDWKRSVGIV